MPPRKRARLNPPAPKVYDVDPEGDLVIEAGKLKAKNLIRVSKAVLTSASPVFDVMLGPNFAEGQTEHTAEKPLKLHDDEGEVMLTLMKLIHDQITDSAEIDYEKLPQLVIMGDKYACLSRLRPWMQSALSMWRNESQGSYLRFRNRKSIYMTLFEAVCIAYIIDDSKNFGYLSRELFHLVTPLSIPMDSGLLDGLIPEEFKNKLMNACQRAHVRAKQCFLEPLRIIGEAQRSAKRQKRDNACREGDERFMLYIKTLMQDGRFDQVTDSSLLAQSVIRANPLQALGQPERFGPSFGDDVEKLPEADPEAKEIAWKDASEKCKEKVCLCQTTLAQSIFQYYQRAEIALGRLCLGCQERSS